MSSELTTQSPLLNKSFRQLFTAQVVALVGTGMTTVALTLLAYDLAKENAGVVLGTALAFKMLAYVVFAPVIGGLAHRLPRKALLISLDLVRAVIVLLMPFVTSVWQIYLLIFLLNLFSAGFKPVFAATIPEVLPDEQQYTKALSYSRLAYDLENLLSPMLAGIGLLFFSYSGLFIFNSVAEARAARSSWRYMGRDQFWCGGLHADPTLASSADALFCSGLRQRHGYCEYGDLR
jgi:MFS family permease